MTQATTSITADSQRLPSRRWPLRALAAAVLTAAIGYITIPLWLPPEWIARQFCNQVSLALNRPVRLERVRLGWLEGIVLEGATIEDKPDSAMGVLARIDRIHCGFTPLHTLITGRVNQIEIDHPEIFLTVDENGRLNIDDLGQNEAAPPPSHHFVIRSLRCQVKVPHATETIHVEWLECRLDPEQGLLRVLTEILPADNISPSTMPSPTITNDRQRLTLHAHLTSPRLKKGTRLGGEIRAEWAGLALTDLPLKLLPRLPFEQLRGTTTGQLSLQTNPDLSVNFNFSISMHEVQVRRQATEAVAQLPESHLCGQGRWDPNMDILELSSLQADTPAVRIDGDTAEGSPVLRIDPLGTSPWAFGAHGIIKDWMTFRHEWPEIDKRICDSGIELDGSTHFELHCTREHQEDHIRLSVDATKASCRIARENAIFLNAAKDINKTILLKLDAGHEGTNPLKSQVHLSIGNASLTGQAEMMIPNTVARHQALNVLASEILKDLQGDFQIHCTDLRKTADLIPAIERAATLADCSGDIRIQLSCMTVQNAKRIGLSVVSDALSTIRIKEFLDKPSGLVLNIKAGCDVTIDGPTLITHPLLEMNYGASRLALDQDNTQLIAEIGTSHKPLMPLEMINQLDATFVLPVSIRDVKPMLGLFSAWPCYNHSIENVNIDGDAKVTLQGRLAFHQDKRLIDCTANVSADDLGIHYQTIFDKPAGKPLGITLAHRQHCGAADEHSSIEASVRGTGGTMTASLTWLPPPSSSWPPNPARTIDGIMKASEKRGSLSLKLTDAKEALSISPAVALRLEPLDPGGELSVAFEGDVTTFHHNFALTVDGTGAAFVIPGAKTWTKPAGLDARINLKGRHNLQESSNGRNTWIITDATGQVGGLQLDHMEGSLVFDHSMDDLNALLERLRNGIGQSLSSIVPVSLRASGHVFLADSSLRLQPEWIEWLSRYDLKGRAGWHLELCSENDGITLRGELDATDTQMQIPFNHKLIPGIQKPDGMPTRLSFDTYLAPKRENGQQVTLRQALIDLDGNRLSAQGTLTLPGFTRPTTISHPTALTCQMDWPQIRRLARMIPRSAASELDGQVKATCEVTCDGSTWHLDKGNLEFNQFVLGIREQLAELNGGVSVKSDAFDLHQLHWTLGGFEGTASGSIRREGEDVVGQIGLAINRLDIEDLRARIAAMRDMTATTTQQVHAGNITAMQQAIAAVRRYDLTFDCHVGALNVLLPPKQKLLAEAASAQIRIKKGPVNINFHGLVDGGVVTGELTSSTQAADPVYHLTYTAEDILPGLLVDSYLQVMFPGMKATGPLTLIDETYQKLLPEKDDPNYEVGVGELIIKGGSVEGRAAPLWMTQYFPGLNLARFDFSYLHSWFKKLPNGRIYHQMIYKGQYYNIYMIGYSDADRQFEYEVGIDFLADFDSKYWADLGQGRVPLFVKTGRTGPDGALLDERVNFVSAERLAETLLVKNNLIITAYHAVRKRVLGKE